MRTRTAAVDADGKAIELYEPVYYFVDCTCMDEPVLHSRVSVGTDGSGANRYDVYRVDRGIYHCSLLRKDGEYLDQCHATDLTTSMKTAVRLLKATVREQKRLLDKEIARHMERAADRRDWKRKLDVRLARELKRCASLRMP